MNSEHDPQFESQLRERLQSTPVPHRDGFKHQLLVQLREEAGADTAPVGRLPMWLQVVAPVFAVLLVAIIGWQISSDTDNSVIADNPVRTVVSDFVDAASAPPVMQFATRSSGDMAMAYVPVSTVDESELIVQLYSHANDSWTEYKPTTQYGEQPLVVADVIATQTRWVVVWKSLTETGSLRTHVSSISQFDGAYHTQPVITFENRFETDALTQVIPVDAIHSDSVHLVWNEGSSTLLHYWTPDEGLVDQAITVPVDALAQPQIVPVTAQEQTRRLYIVGSTSAGLVATTYRLMPDNSYQVEASHTLTDSANHGLLGAGEANDRSAYVLYMEDDTLYHRELTVKHTMSAPSVVIEDTFGLTDIVHEYNQFGQGQLVVSWSDTDSSYLRYWIPRTQWQDSLTIEQLPTLYMYPNGEIEAVYVQDTELGGKRYDPSLQTWQDLSNRSSVVDDYPLLLETLEEGVTYQNTAVLLYSDIPDTLLLGKHKLTNEDTALVDLDMVGTYLYHAVDGEFVFLVVLDRNDNTVKSIVTRLKEL